MKTIWGNMVVKNEDKYIWFAIKSVINFLDKLLIYDTGSKDRTVEIINGLIKEYPDKIIFEEKNEVNAEGLTRLRQEMLERTKSDWFLLIDGDEVWWQESLNKVVDKINSQDKNLYALVNPTINLVGDIHHYQEKAAGEYRILGQKGHFNIRAINRKIPGLHLKKAYPLEGYFDKDGNILQSLDKNLAFVDAPLLHFSFLQRSSINDSNTLHRRKVKTEIGKVFEGGFKYPEVFYLDRPEFIDDPFKKMGIGYKVRAHLITPFKKVRRRLRK